MSHSIVGKSAVAGLLAIAASASFSQAVLIQNHDLEEMSIGGAAFVFTPPANTTKWDLAGPSGLAVSVDQPNLFSAVGGGDGQFSFIKTSVARPGTATLSQNISLTSTGAFVVAYLEAGRATAASNPTFGGDLNYRVTITPVGGGAAILNALESTQSNQPFIATNLAFNVPSTGDYVLAVTAVSNGNALSDNTAFFDNFLIAPAGAIPEPMSLSVAMLAAGGLVARRRR